MFNAYPYMNAFNTANLANTATKTGLLSRINFSSFLTNASKTLNFINQAIPVYHQVKPIVKNIRTLSSITKGFNNINSNTNNNISNNSQLNKNNNYYNNSFNNSIPKPNFFIE